MKTVCLIRFGSTPDPQVSLAIGLLSADPVSHALKTDGVIITVFKTDLSIDRCRKSIKRYSENFILLDITKAGSVIPVCGHGEMAYETLVENKMELSPDEREKHLFDKIRVLGNSSLTTDEHEFLKSRL
jgi:hypothetical protein